MQLVLVDVHFVINVLWFSCVNPFLFWKKKNT